jgi:hypothetical protein
MKLHFLRRKLKWQGFIASFVIKNSVRKSLKHRGGLAVLAISEYEW